MEKRHILLNNIEFRKIKELLVPREFSYSTQLGAWTDSNGALLFDHAEFGAVASKKKDIEIGEDQK